MPENFNGIFTIEFEALESSTGILAKFVDSGISVFRVSKVTVGKSEELVPPPPPTLGGISPPEKRPKTLNIKILNSTK